MRLVLEVVSGPHRGMRIEVGAGETVRVGRTRKADVALADNFMSGTHFALECDSKGCRLKDLKSSNGTKLNGELIIEGALKDGDQIFAGRTDFIVRLEAAPEPAAAAEQPLPRARPVSSARTNKSGSRKLSKKLAAPEASQHSPKFEQSVAPAVEAKEAQPTAIPPQPPIEKSARPPVASEPPGSGSAELASATALDSYESVTPDGRLLHILSNQRQPLMALIDAVRDLAVLELLRTHGEEYQSLYTSEQNPALAPYLVRVRARSELLKQMIQKGWGREWGVYLTSPLSLSELRQYFRTTLMVIVPDGMELFSRFYDPRFFRGFLESCSADEAEKFFGPVTSYFMEGERPEILLEFAKSKTGADKKGHLLSDLG